jgi:hypothetical protein
MLPHAIILFFVILTLYNGAIFIRRMSRETRGDDRAYNVGGGSWGQLAHHRARHDVGPESEKSDVGQRRTA